MTLPQLRLIRLQDLRYENVPQLRIKTDLDVENWKTTRGYADYSLFLRRLCESAVGFDLPYRRDHTLVSFSLLRIAMRCI
jgi:serine/threonine-protein phosphatase 2A activator